MSDPLSMPAGRDPDSVYRLACELLEAGAVELSKVLTPREMPLHAAVWPGAPDTEHCCAGQIYVYLQNIGPVYSDFPTQDFTAMRPCNAPVGAVDLILGYAMCTPVGDEHRPPSADEMNQAGRQGMTAAWAIWRAAICKGLEWVDDPYGLSVGPNVLTPLDDAGGCVGYEVRLTVGLNPLCAGC